MNADLPADDPMAVPGRLERHPASLAGDGHGRHLYQGADTGGRIADHDGARTDLGPRPDGDIDDVLVEGDRSDGRCIDPAPEAISPYRRVRGARLARARRHFQWPD